MEFRFTEGRTNVHHLTAPYDLLVQAFGNDGTVVPRDIYKSMAEWDLLTPHGEVEVYDYKIGTCYNPHGPERHEITTWSVQGEPDAIGHMLSLLTEAGGTRLT